MTRQESGGNINNFPGALSLINELDTLVMVILRDGRHLVGKLSSFDQYSNLVLEDCEEWFLYKNLFATCQLGLFIIKSESVVVVSAVDLDKLEVAGLEEVDVERINEEKRNGEEEVELWFME